MRTPNDEWVRIGQGVLEHGHIANPRGMFIRERLAFQSDIDMRNPILTNPVRKLGYKFMLGEAYWILSGRDDVDFISKYSKEIRKFSDDGMTFFGAYGPKIVEQLNYIVRTLTEDPESRQAVINIWRESPGKSKDIPCTVSVQWIIRGNHLHCIDTMRSSDLWLGWPYDIFNFSMLSVVIALLLKTATGKKYELGRLYLTAGSSHIYQRNEELFKEAFWNEEDPYSGIRLDIHRNWELATEFMDSMYAYLDHGAAKWFEDYAVTE